ncbi:MAG TPA: hypothetical protein VJS68_01430 [Thermoplasmata archaeon]|nr:hypothetical protein [Thermoplasmata archaeon]
MEVDIAGVRYEWVDNWARAPDPEITEVSWPHSAIVWSGRRELWTFHPAKSEAIAFDSDGRFLRAVPSPLTEAHGITLVEERGEQFLWMADASRKRGPENNYRAPDDAPHSAVVKSDLAGNVVQSLSPPPHPAYQSGVYRPTWVAVNEERFGGNGDIWVADGYGESLVHRYRADGQFLSTLTGAEGAGRFRGPHLAFLDTRRAEPELYIADRSNSRIQVYDTEGRFRRVVGAGTLSSPTAFARDGDRLLVMQYYPPRLVALDGQDRLLALAGENLSPILQPGFPFVRGEDGKPATPKNMGAGKFGVPHSIAIDDRGNLYFAEVVFGSRFTKLRRRGETPDPE